MKAQIINDAIITPNFSESYPLLNKYMFENAKYQDSRNGPTKEILDFKTTLTNPYQRCVGNNGRNINIFFLMAEAIWIFAGKKDLATLELFNGQMKEYSDDGVNFHAPYGHRIRHAGIPAIPVSSLLTSPDLGHDQLYDALEEFSINSESRQVVLQIWDERQDLGMHVKVKDKPCNDLVFLKIRDGKLITTIANRSNDLHWGLPTNIFQFSFTTEIMSLILGIELGTQTHNSHSLHFYLNNPIAETMYENMQFQPAFKDLYEFAEAEKIAMYFPINSDFHERLNVVDDQFERILYAFLNGGMPESDRVALGNFSPHIAFYYDLCDMYLEYKKAPVKNDDLKWACIDSIFDLTKKFGKILDVAVLAQNFFYSRLENKEIGENLTLICPNLL